MRGLVFRVQGSGFRVSGLGFRVRPQIQQISTNLRAEDSKECILPWLQKRTICPLDRRSQPSSLLAFCKGSWKYGLAL